MTISYDESITFGSTITIDDARNIPSSSEIVIATTNATGATSFSNWNLATGLQVGSNYGSFANTYTFCAMDSIQSSLLAVAFINGSTDIWTVNTSTGASIDLGSLYSSGQQIRQIACSLSLNSGVAVPPLTRPGELGTISSSSVVSLIKPLWLEGYSTYCACALDTGTGFMLCSGFANSTDVTFFNINSSFILVNSFTLSSPNLIPANITEMRHTNGYIVLATTNCLFIIDYLSGTIVQEFPMASVGSAHISSLINTEIILATEPYLTELDIYTTPPTVKGFFNTSYTSPLLGKVEVNSSANKVWLFQSGSHILDIGSISGFRSTTTKTLQMTNGSGVQSEMMLFNDSVSPCQLIFSSSIPPAGRSVPLPTGTDIIILGYYGDGQDQHFEVDRKST